MSKLCEESAGFNLEASGFISPSSFTVLSLEANLVPMAVLREKAAISLTASSSSAVKVGLFLNAVSYACSIGMDVYINSSITDSAVGFNASFV